VNCSAQRLKSGACPESWRTPERRLLEGGSAGARAVRCLGSERAPGEPEEKRGSPFLTPDAWRCCGDETGELCGVSATGSVQFPKRSRGLAHGGGSGCFFLPVTRACSKHELIMRVGVSGHSKNQERTVEIVSSVVCEIFLLLKTATQMLTTRRAWQLQYLYFQRSRGVG
jgi:hypothetical protein